MYIMYAPVLSSNTPLAGWLSFGSFFSCFYTHLFLEPETGCSTHSIARANFRSTVRLLILSHIAALCFIPNLCASFSVFLRLCIIYETLFILILLFDGCVCVCLRRSFVSCIYFNLSGKFHLIFCAHIHI